MNLNPFIRYARVQLVEAAQTGKYYGHDCRLFLSLSADFSMEIDGVVKSVPVGSLVFIPPYTPYRFLIFTANIKLAVLNFDTNPYNTGCENCLWTHLWSEYQGVVYPPDMPPEFSKPIVFAASDSMRASVLKTTELFLYRESYFRELASAYLSVVLVSILRDTAKQVAHSPLTKAVMDFVAQNYRLGCSNHVIADKLGYHPVYLSQVVKADTGMSLQEYVTHYRLRMAANLLLASDCSITEIASQCGIPSPAYFTHLFHRTFGLPPRAYRKKNSLV